MNERIQGGYSIHSVESPEKCTPETCLKRHARIVDCCHQIEDRDIIECELCGKQWDVPCYFDEDFK